MNIDTESVDLALTTTRAVRKRLDLERPVDDVWAAVTDIDLLAQFSDEFNWATWDEGFDGPALGATFSGRNHLEVMGDWEVPCFVDVCEEPVAFGWCTSDPDNPGTRVCWTFSCQAASLSGCFRVFLSGSVRRSLVKRRV